MTFHPPRGISPELLVSQVKNTAPYVFETDSPENPLNPLEPAQFLRSCSQRLEKSGSQIQLTHLEYFKLCLCAHYLSCATPVPTDVDQQIRFKLWHEKLPLETTLEMTQIVLQSRHWDFRGISQRYLSGAKDTPWATEILSGHLGEWFTVACAAYAALDRSQGAIANQKRDEVLSHIVDEIQRHSEIFASLWQAQDGIACLKASALIAHNLGDLDRVMDLWGLSTLDPLRAQFYKLTTEPLDSLRKLRYRGRLWVAGELYKAEILGSSMAAENHRHFALRKPRVIRQSPQLLIPIGPFFDEWGQTTARFLNAEPTQMDALQEIGEALIHGWERLSKSIGYGRALLGILREIPDFRKTLPNLEGVLKIKRNRKLLETPREAFESQWHLEALRKMEEIPSKL